MIKGIIRVFWFCLFSAVAWWLIGGFIHLEFNVFEWTVGGRFIYLFLSLATGLIFGIAYLIHMDEKEQRERRDASEMIHNR